jgi:hypothetical protein
VLVAAGNDPAPDIRNDLRMGRVERDREIARRRARRTKLKKLRVRFAKATDAASKKLILAKARRLSPFAVLEEPEPSNG